MLTTCGFSAHLLAAWKNIGSSGIKFTDVELAGDTELAAPVKKVATGWPSRGARVRVLP
jgi:glutaredoxin-related protein